MSENSSGDITSLHLGVSVHCGKCIHCRSSYRITSGAMLVCNTTHNMMTKPEIQGRQVWRQRGLGKNQANEGVRGANPRHVGPRSQKRSRSTRIRVGTPSDTKTGGGHPRS